MSKVYPLGTYKINKVGNSHKISVHPKIIEKWGLKNEDDNDNGETPDVYIYAERRDGKIIMVASLEPMDEFDWLE